MFTGIIEGKGRIVSLTKGNKEARIRISPMFKGYSYTKGESIAVNGACLTVETFGKDWFEVYASSETMNVTSLSLLKSSSVVNLEKAMKADGRFGGHFVSGHVDCVGKIDNVNASGSSTVYRISYPEEHSLMVVPKGSVCLDGISLTVNSCGEGWLEVNIIPETQKVTTVDLWTKGSKINMETDIIGKYVCRNMQKTEKQGITMEFLAEHGF